MRMSSDRIRVYDIDESMLKREETFTFYYPSSQRSFTAWKRIDSIETTFWDDADSSNLL